MKFRQFKPSFYDDFERPSNAGLKPNFTPRLQVRETPQVLVDRQRDQRNEGIPLRISKSSESYTWRSTEARLADPNRNRKTTFELHLRKDVPRLVQRCQRNCGKEITEDWLFGSEILWNKQMDRQKQEGKTQIWTDVPSLWEKLPSKLWFRNSYGASQSFDYGRITVDQKCKDQLSEAENRFITGLGLTFNDVFNYSYLFLNFCL